MNDVERYKALQNTMLNIYERKNHDYGSSASQTYNEFGPVAYLVRISDKFNRLKALSNGATQQVNDESIIDTAVDMANYLMLMVLDMTKEEKNG